MVIVKGLARIQWQGIDQYQAKLTSLAKARTRVHKEYLSIIGDLTLKMIQQAAPRDTGEYANSWKIIQRGEKFIIIDTEQQDLFVWLENGTAARGFKDKQPHIIYVQKELDNVMRSVMRTQIKKHSKLFNFIDTKSGMAKTSNITKTVGLTGTKVSSLRGRGKISMVRARTGRKQFKRRLGRRRRTGQWIKRATLE